MGDQFDDDKRRTSARDWRDWHYDEARDRDRDRGFGEYARQPPYAGQYTHPDRSYERGRQPEWSERDRVQLDRFGRDRWTTDPGIGPDFRERGEWRPRLDDWRSGDFRMRDPYGDRDLRDFGGWHSPHHARMPGEGPREGSHVLEDIKRGARRLFRGIKGYTRPDDRIREDVCDRINAVGEHLDADFGEVDVRVQNGEVTLAGTLRDRRQKHLVENAADSVGGVKDVHNLIRVRREDEAVEAGRSETGAVPVGARVGVPNGNRAGSA